VLAHLHTDYVGQDVTEGVSDGALPWGYDRERERERERVRDALRQ